MERVSRWSQGVDTVCVLCKQAMETRAHLFFECSYSASVWEHLTKGILRSEFTNIWSEVVLLITERHSDKKRLFCIRYAFQVCIHAVWRVRNKIRDGEKLVHVQSLKKFIDKGIRNKLSLLRSKGGKGWEDILQYWFAKRM